MAHSVASEAPTLAAGNRGAAHLSSTTCMTCSARKASVRAETVSLSLSLPLPACLSSLSLSRRHSLTLPYPHVTSAKIKARELRHSEKVAHQRQHAISVISSTAPREANDFSVGPQGRERESEILLPSRSKAAAGTGTFGSGLKEAEEGSPDHWSRVRERIFSDRNGLQYGRRTVELQEVRVCMYSRRFLGTSLWYIYIYMCV